jgi:hypothetical protein
VPIRLDKETHHCCSACRKPATHPCSGKTLRHLAEAEALTTQEAVDAERECRKRWRRRTERLR